MPPFARVLSLLCLVAAITAPALHVLLKIRAAPPLDTFSLRYVSPMVGVFFLWASFAVRTRETWIPRVLLVDAAVVALSVLRAVVPIVPASGHVLFLAYTIATVRSPWYRIPAAVVLLDALVVKLTLWNDYGTSTFGLVLAAVFVVVRNAAVRRVEASSPESAG